MDKKFAEGVFVKEKTFDWGTITQHSYKVDEFVKFLQANANDKGYVNVDFKKSKDGSKIYGEVNTFEPKPQGKTVNMEESDSHLPF